MNTIINFFRKAVKDYFNMTAPNYAWMYTGCVYKPNLTQDSVSKDHTA